MLYDNHGRDLDRGSLVNDFHDLEPVDSLARRYDISEEQVFEVVGGRATFETLNAIYEFDFGASPPTVTRRRGSFGGALPGDEQPLTLLTVTRWTPLLEMYLVLPGRGTPTLRITSEVMDWKFSND